MSRPGPQGDGGGEVGPPRAGVPLAGSYPAAVALALLALCPFLVLSSASALFEDQIMRDLGAGPFVIALASGLASAGYAFGAVLAADLVQRVPARSLFLACEVGFVAGSVLASVAPGPVAFVVGRTVQGVATGMLLVAALPPLVTNHGADKLPLTAAFVSLGLFGIVTLGPWSAASRPSCRCGGRCSPSSPGSACSGW